MAKIGTNSVLSATDKTIYDMKSGLYNLQYARTETEDLLERKSSVVHTLTGIYKKDNCTMSASFQHPSHKQTYEVNIKMDKLKFPGGDLVSSFTATTIVESSGASQTGVASLTANLFTPNGNVSVQMKGTAKSNGLFNDFNLDNVSLSLDVPFYKMGDYVFGAKGQQTSSLRGEKRESSGQLYMKWKINDVFNLFVSVDIARIKNNGNASIKKEATVDLSSSWVF